ESNVLDARFELLPDYPREWPANARVRFHLGASEVIGRLVLLEGGPLRPGATALAQLRLERPAVAARGDRFVIRSYSPSRTVGGGAVIEPVAAKRRRHAAGLEQLTVHESGSLAARLLQRLAGERAPVSTSALAQAVGAARRYARRAREARGRARGRRARRARGRRMAREARRGCGGDRSTGLVPRPAGARESRFHVHSPPARGPTRQARRPLRAAPGA